MTQLKKVIVCITGGIAAYKAVELVRLLTLDKIAVQVVMSENAHNFIGAMSLQAVSGREVRTSLFDSDHEAAMGHIELAKWADAIVIAPASANIIAKLAYGTADCLISTLCLATKAPIYIAPAMNSNMWHARATQQNINILTKDKQFTLIGPAEGVQACGDIGLGRMVEPESIRKTLLIEKTNNNSILKNYLKDLNVLITAGPTVEYIDPVRYISNRSSGKMGYALAAACEQAGAKVTLISGPVNLNNPDKVHVIQVTTAQQMYVEVLKCAKSSDIYIATAAVADFKSADYKKAKIKRKDKNLSLELVQNKDITRAVTALTPKPFSVGFAAETHELKENAQRKLKYKAVDMLVANDVSDASIGFDSNYNEVLVLTSEAEFKLNFAEKSVISQQLVKLIAKRYYESDSTKSIRSKVRQSDSIT